MSRPQKILTICLWGLMVIAMVAMVASGMFPRIFPGRHEDPAPGVPAFNLVDQEGEPFSNQNLEGQVWIADFIFTRCAGPCPEMTRRMGELQKTLGDSPVKLVSFTVDPTYDTPAVLKSYGQERGADLRRWTFATGDQDAIHQLSRSMMLTAEVGQDGQFIHSERFILVDREGRIHRIYSALDPAKLDLLVADARKLAGSGRP